MINKKKKKRLEDFFGKEGTFSEPEEDGLIYFKWYEKSDDYNFSNTIMNWTYDCIYALILCYKNDKSAIFSISISFVEKVFCFNSYLKIHQYGDNFSKYNPKVWVKFCFYPNFSLTIPAQFWPDQDFVDQEPDSPLQFNNDELQRLFQTLGKKSVVNNVEFITFDKKNALGFELILKFCPKTKTVQLWLVFEKYTEPVVNLNFVQVDKIEIQDNTLKIMTKPNRTLVQVSFQELFTFLFPELD